MFSRRILTVACIAGLLAWTPAHAGIFRWLAGPAVGVAVEVAEADLAINAAVRSAVLAYGTGQAARTARDLALLIQAHPIVGRGHATTALANVAANDPRAKEAVAWVASVTQVGAQAVDAKERSVLGGGTSPMPDPRCDTGDDLGTVASSLPEVDNRKRSHPGQRLPPTSYANKLVPINVDGRDLTIRFDGNGFPDFGPHVVVDLKVADTRAFFAGDHRRQLALATEALRDRVVRREIDRNLFTPYQMRDIAKGNYKVTDYTWHHHQDPGRMQLVPDKIHSAVHHYGGWFANKCLQDPPRE